MRCSNLEFSTQQIPSLPVLPVLPPGGTLYAHGFFPKFDTRDCLHLELLYKFEKKSAHMRLHSNFLYFLAKLIANLRD
jgi:hypothetical protein